MKKNYRVCFLASVAGVVFFSACGLQNTVARPDWDSVNKNLDDKSQLIFIARIAPKNKFDAAGLSFYLDGDFIKNYGVIISPRKKILGNEIAVSLNSACPEKSGYIVVKTGVKNKEGFSGHQFLAFTSFVASEDMSLQSFWRGTWTTKDHFFLPSDSSCSNCGKLDHSGSFYGISVDNLKPGVYYIGDIDITGTLLVLETHPYSGLTKTQWWYETDIKTEDKFSEAMEFAEKNLGLPRDRIVNLSDKWRKIDFGDIEKVLGRKINMKQLPEYITSAK